MRVSRLLMGNQLETFHVSRKLRDTLLGREKNVDDGEWHFVHWRTVGHFIFQPHLSMYARPKYNLDFKKFFIKWSKQILESKTGIGLFLSFEIYHFLDWFFCSPLHHQWESWMVCYFCLIPKCFRHVEWDRPPQTLTVNVIDTPLFTQGLIECTVS